MQQFKNMCIVSVMLILFSSLAWASGDGEADSSQWINLLYRVINFTIVAGIIYYFVGKKAAAFFAGRSRQIETQMLDLDVRRQKAESELRKVEARIANLETEKAAILQDAREQGEAVKAGIIAEAEKTAARIQAQAEMAAEQEVRQALTLIREQVAQEIVTEAEKIITGQLKGKDHEALIQDSLSKVVVH